MSLIDRFKPPEGWQEGAFKNKDGANIHFGYAKPKGESKGIIVITTGFAGYGREYFENLNNYVDHGYTVYAMDWQGHGNSDPFDSAVTPYEKRFDAHVRDLHHLVTEIIKPDGTQPLTLSTHSLGGHIGLRYAHDHPDVFDAMILGAPMIHVNTYGFPKTMWRLFIQTMVKLGYGEDPLPSRALLGQAFGAARNALGIPQGNGDLRKAFAKAVSQTPIGHKIADAILSKTEELFDLDIKRIQPSFLWMLHALNSIDMVNREDYLKSIKIPLLFGICSEDDLVDNAAIHRAARLTGNQMNTVVLDGAGHGLWHERDEIIYEWWIHIVNFLDRVGADFKARHDVKSENRNAFEQAAENDRKPARPQEPAGAGQRPPVLTPVLA